MATAARRGMSTLQSVFFVLFSPPPPPPFASPTANVTRDGAAAPVAASPEEDPGVASTPRGAVPTN